MLKTAMVLSLISMSSALADTSPVNVELSCDARRFPSIEGEEWQAWEKVVEAISVSAKGGPGGVEGGTFQIGTKKPVSLVREKKPKDESQYVYSLVGTSSQLILDGFVSVQDKGEETRVQLRGSGSGLAATVEYHCRRAPIPSSPVFRDDGDDLCMKNAREAIFAKIRRDVPGTIIRSSDFVYGQFAAAHGPEVHSQTKFTVREIIGTTEPNADCLLDYEVDMKGKEGSSTSCAVDSEVRVRGGNCKTKGTNSKKK
jgi:hypothetical protein